MISVFFRLVTFCECEKLQCDLLIWFAMRLKGKHNRDATSSRLLRITSILSLNLRFHQLKCSSLAQFPNDGQLLTIK